MLIIFFILKKNPFFHLGIYDDKVKDSKQHKILKLFNNLFLTNY
jgi:hypothetical protein